MSPPDSGGTEGPPVGAEPAPPGIRLRKLIGAAGIVTGSGMVIVMPFLDSLNGVRVSGALSAQDLGILAGFAILLTGVLLYLGSVISHMEHRHRGLEKRIEGLLGAPGEEPVAAPNSTVDDDAALARPAAQPDAAAVPPAESPVQARETGLAPEASAVDSPATAHTETAEKVEAPVPIPETLPPVPGTSDAAPLAPEATPPAGTVCPVCGNELTGGVCRHCITSAAIQGAYQELSRTQELGASVEEAAALLGSARDSLEMKDYREAGEYVRSSRYLLEISAKTYFALRSAVEKAESERKKLEDSGLDTTELSSKLSDARSAIVRGDYQEAKTILDQERSAVSDLRVPYFQRPARGAPQGEPGNVPPSMASIVSKMPIPVPAPVFPRREAHVSVVPSKDGPEPKAPGYAKPATEAPIKEEPAPEVPGKEEPAPEPPAKEEPEPSSEAAGQEEPAAVPAVPGKEGTATGPSLPVPDQPPAEPAPVSSAPTVTDAVPPAQSQRAVPKFSSGIAACPKCGRKTMKGWKKCPHCLAPLN
jgi:hypothetical protein